MIENTTEIEIDMQHLIIQCVIVPAARLLSISETYKIVNGNGAGMCPRDNNPTKEQNATKGLQYSEKNSAPGEILQLVLKQKFVPYIAIVYSDNRRRIIRNI